MTDLMQLQDLVEGQDRGAELVVKHPVTGEPMPDVVLIVAGPDSDVQRWARLKQQDELYSYKQRPPASEFDRMEIDRLARCVVAWRVKRGGEDVPFAFSAVVRMLTEFRFIREQVEAFAQSRIDYFLRLPIEDPQ